MVDYVQKKYNKSKWTGLSVDITEFYINGGKIVLEGQLIIGPLLKRFMDDRVIFSYSLKSIFPKT